MVDQPTVWRAASEIVLILRGINYSVIASEQAGNNPDGFQDFDLRAKATFRP